MFVLWKDIEIGVMEMIARCGVSFWLVPALAWIGVCYADPIAWIMADLLA